MPGCSYPSDEFPRAGTPYEQEEIDELCVLAEHPDARDHDRLATIAPRYGRTPDAVEMVIRWAQRADFPDKAQNRISRQVTTARSRLKDRQYAASVRAKLQKAGLLT